MSKASLLPPNAGAQERALDLTTSRLADVDVPIASLWDPFACPADLLPWLAWALSVDLWHPGLSEETRRNMIAGSVAWHRRKGTVWAVKEALRLVGLGEVDIEERLGEPYLWAEFRVRLDLPLGATEDDFDLATWAIDLAKPARSWLAALRLTGLGTDSVYLGAPVADGETISILPRVEFVGPTAQRYAGTGIHASTVTAIPVYSPTVDADNATRVAAGAAYIIDKISIAHGGT